MPAAIVSGVATPETVNPAAAMFTLETIRSAWPVLPSNTVCVLLLPTATDPKSRLEGCSERTPGFAGVLTVPISATVGLPLEAFVVSETEPVYVPDVDGVKRTVKEIAWPGWTVAGRLAPATEKPVPVVVALCTVRFAVPELVTVRTFVVVVPAVTLPKSIEVGRTCTCGPLWVEVVAVPVTGTSGTATVELLAMVTAPLNVPADAGAKVTINGAD